VWRGFRIGDFEDAGNEDTEALHDLIDELPEEQMETARQWLENLRDAAHPDGPPLDAKILDSIDRGLTEVAAGRTKSVSEYERERRL